MYDTVVLCVVVVIITVSLTSDVRLSQLLMYFHMLSETYFITLVHPHLTKAVHLVVTAGAYSLD